MPSSRRALGASALPLAAALAAALLLVGCTSGDDATSSPAPGTPPASSTTPSSPAPSSPAASPDPFPSLGPDAQVAIGLPAEGSTVSGPFRFAGSSNTFEATVLWSVQRPDGSVVQKGFAQATSGTGTPGTFDTSIDLGSFTGPAVIVAGGEGGESGGLVGEDRVSFTVN